MRLWTGSEPEREDKPSEPVATRAEKAPDAFRTISEAADELDLPQHVLRFWETRFPQIKPLKRGGGRRYYRPEDVDLLRGIKHLLYGEGYTIKGVQRILKSQGLRFVQQVWRDPASLAAAADAARAADLDDDTDAFDEGLGGARNQAFQDPIDSMPSTVSGPESTVRPEIVMAPAPPPAATPVATPPSGGSPTAATPTPVAPATVASATASAAVDTRRLVLRPPDDEPAPGSRLSREDVRRLQAALFELIEARKLIDAMK